MTTEPYTIGPDHGPGPLPALGKSTVLRAQAALTSAFVESTIINVSEARRATLYFAYDGVTSESSSRAQFIVMASDQSLVGGVHPVIGDDVWYSPPTIDAVATDGALSGSMPSGFDATITPTWRNYAVGPTSFSTQALSAAADKQRFYLAFDMTGAKWLVVIAKELGDTAHPGKLTINCTLSL
jgi:hypothetical protein